MSVNVEFSLANFAPGYCWAGPQTFATDLIALLTGTIPGTFSSFNFGSTTPAPEDQDKPWIKTDVSGNLEGVYTYNGVWVRPHPVPYASNYVAMWKGSEADLWAFDGGDGTDPSTNPPTDTSGAMWVRDTDFDFRIPLGVGTSDTDYGGGATTVAVGGEGGEEKHVLTAAEMPAHSHGLAGAGLVTNQVGGYNVQGSGVAVNVVFPVSQGSDDAHENMPPYRAVYFIKRSARKYYTA